MGNVLVDSAPTGNWKDVSVDSNGYTWAVDGNKLLKTLERFVREGGEKRPHLICQWYS